MVMYQSWALQSLLTGTHKYQMRYVCSILSRNLLLYCIERSLLADIIQPQDVKELCSVLVVYGGEAAKMLAGMHGFLNNPIFFVVY